jgi:2-haloacid dehalogenase
MSGDRWVTFDCFGTLIDWLTGFRAILAPAAGARTDELISAYHAFERELEVEKPHRLYRDVLTSGVSQAAAKIGLDLPADDADLLARRWGEQPLYADTLASLDQLRRAGWKIGVLTNCDDLGAPSEADARHGRHGAAGRQLQARAGTFPAL